MIHTLIVDDEPLCLNELRYLLSSYKDINIDFEATNLDDALEILQTQSLDLVFLDIEMDNQKAGLTIAKKIEQQNNSPDIIFLTAHPQHALKAFDFQPLHYLLKPISQTKLDLAIQRAREISRAEPTVPGKIALKYKTYDEFDEIIRPTIYLSPEEILYIHKDKLSNTTNLFTTDGNQYKGIRHTLQYFEERLSDSDFFRTHTSYLVNLLHVQGQKPRTSGEESNILTLKNSTAELPISKSKIRTLKTVLSSLA